MSENEKPAARKPPVMTNGKPCPWPQCSLKGKCAHAELCGEPYDPEEG